MSDQVTDEKIYENLMAKWTRATEEKKEKKARESKYWKNFYVSLFRVAYLHSWYKLKGISRHATIIPVLETVQESHNFEHLFEPDDIVWHFNVNDDSWT